jgi:hypothetical protein
MVSHELKNQNKITITSIILDFVCLLRNKILDVIVGWSAICPTIQQTTQVSMNFVILIKTEDKRTFYTCKTFNMIAIRFLYNKYTLAYGRDRKLVELHMQSGPITIKVVSSNFAHGEVNNIM